MEKYNKFLRNITELIEKGLFTSKDLKKDVSKSFASELPSIDGRIIWPCIASVSAKGSTKIIALPPASKYWSIENSVFSDVFL